MAEQPSFSLAVGIFEIRKTRFRRKSQNQQFQIMIDHILPKINITKTAAK